MPERQLYVLAVPESAQIRNREGRRRNISTQGTVDASDTPAVEPIASDAETRTLDAQFLGAFAELTAAEFRELFTASGFGVVPYTRTGEAIDIEDGYYSLEQADRQPSTATTRRAQEFRGTLRKVGTKRSHWRSLATAPTTEDNPFGSASTEQVGISDRATKVRWFDEVDGSLENASATTTRTGEHDDIAIYDATDPSIADPTLIYRLDYRHEWRVDCRVFDDRDADRLSTQTDSGDTVGSATVGSATVSSSTEALQWQRVFATDHDYRGLPVLENDILRLRFDEPRQRLEAYRWNADDKHYDAIQLGTSSWRLYDLDVRRIGPGRVDAQVEFENTSSAGTTHNLNLSLKRGYRDGLWLNPDNEGSVPSALTDRLDPIAHDSDQDPGGVADVVERAKTDR